MQAELLALSNQQVRLLAETNVARMKKSAKATVPLGSRSMHLRYTLYYKQFMPANQGYYNCQILHTFSSGFLIYYKNSTIRIV